MEIIAQTAKHGLWVEKDAVSRGNGANANEPNAVIPYL